MNVSLTVNGLPARLSVEPRRTLGDALREDLGLTGTHLACEHGVCGACTVVVGGEAVRSCLLLAVQCEGADVITIEGLAGADGSLHPLQEAFARENGVQCGYCTPGFIMLAFAALDVEPEIVEDEVRLRELLSSNVCRCTGYVGIRRAVISAARRW
jgi:carbon-monoxide dehydrogenase small subunit